MSLEWIGITVLWTFLYGYLIVASIDFGAGFFSYYSLLTRQEHVISQVIDRYLSPVWEVTNVFLVFFFVGIVGFFPDTAYYFGTALLIPGGIALLLLTIRGSFYAFANYGARKSRIYLFLYGMTGLFIPAALSTVLTISEGGFIRETAAGYVEFLPRRYSPVPTPGRWFSSPWSVCYTSVPVFSSFTPAKRKTKKHTNCCESTPSFGADRRSWPVSGYSWPYPVTTWFIFKTWWTWPGCFCSPSPAFWGRSISLGGEKPLVGHLFW